MTWSRLNSELKIGGKTENRDWEMHGSRFWDRSVVSLTSRPSHLDRYANPIINRLFFLSAAGDGVVCIVCIDVLYCMYY